MLLPPKAHLALLVCSALLAWAALPLDVMAQAAPGGLPAAAAHAAAPPQADQVAPALPAVPAWPLADPPFSRSVPEVRGTWLTTTANDALATPQRTAQTMRRLREIGLNTVYIEAWKNGFTQFPSQVLERTIGLDRRPPGAEQDPSDTQAARRAASRDLLHEAVTEAHRQGLVAIAWFEYGFMAAHQSTLNPLRRLKREWLSLDRQGREVAPNGFVWLNPLHPQAREFLLDLMLEAVDRYDLDGVQLDDRIVWPHVTMGYDAYTRQVYASEHGGASPPDDPHDPAWMQWRADKVDEAARWFVQELRARRPGLVLSLSPAVHPWAWENYLLDWPRWTAWTAADRLPGPPVRTAAAREVVPAWDEFIPQAYRFNLPAFESTWQAQTTAVQAAGAYRPARLVAGIRLVGDGADSSWPQLEGSIAQVRRLGQGGHVLWFSRGVLDLFAQELKTLYARSGPAHSPRFPVGWRPGAVVLRTVGLPAASPARDNLAPAGDSSQTTPVQEAGGLAAWAAEGVPAGRYRVLAFIDGAWQDQPGLVQAATGPLRLQLPDRRATAVELLPDRREALRQVPLCRLGDAC